MDTKPLKLLGQHWLQGEFVDLVTSTAELVPGDHVLEVGPGPGVLTKALLGLGSYVTAVELDHTLVQKLRSQGPSFLGQGKDGPLGTLEVLEEDILQFDLDKMPQDYKVVANIPYYLTGKLIRRLVEANNPPETITLLIQKEVAERLAAQAGNMSILSVGAQLFGKVTLGPVIPPEAFTPPPKVNSQVVHIVRHKTPPLPDIDTKEFFRLVKAGFGEKRKKLRSSLSGGLAVEKSLVDELLEKSQVSPDARAQELDLHDWYRLWQTWKS